MKEVVLGMDIGGTNTAMGLTDRSGHIHKTASIKTREYTDVNAYVKDIGKLVHDVLGDEYKLLGIGIGAPTANHYQGTLDHSPNLNFKGIVPIVRLIQEELKVPTILANDANAAAIGEMFFGGAKNMKHFIMVTLGTGVGSGFVNDGKLIYGQDSFAGELGHVIIISNGRQCGCGRKGCLEQYTSGTGIVKTFIEKHKEKTGVEPKDITAYDVMVEAQNGNPMAIETFDYTGKILGLALSNAVLITGPEAIFLFGGPMKAGDLLLDPIKKYMEEYMLFLYKGKVKVKLSELMDKNAAILGASALIWQHLDAL